MKKIILFVSILSTVSCSHTSNYHKLKDKVESYEAKNLSDIKEDVELTLQSHPELDETSKNNLNLHLNEAITKQQELKNKESKIVQTMLDKSLTPEKGNIQKINILKKELNNLYTEKANNMNNLIDNILKDTYDSKTDEVFFNEMGLIMREIRQ
jgi:hypothetical protein